MGLDILKILALLNFVFFTILMLLTKHDKNKVFIKYILLSFPLLSINLYNEISCFDAITISFILFFYQKTNIQFREGIVYTLLFFVFISSIIIGIFSSIFQMEWATLYLFISVLTVFFYSKLILDECLAENQYLFSVLKYLKWTLIISFIFLLLQFIIGVKLSLSNHQNPNIVSSEGIRYPSFLSDPQVYAQYLGILCLICLIEPSSIMLKKYYGYILSLFCLIAILITGGRAGLVGLIIAFSIVVFLSNYRLKISFLSISIIIYFIINRFLDNLMIFNRGTELNEAYVFRYSVWMDALQIFFQHPFLGIGLGNYANYVFINFPDQVWLRNGDYITFDHPESGYLKILTETGIIGFVCFLLLCIIPVINGIKYYVIKKDSVVLLLAASIVCWMVGFYSTFSLGETRLRVLVVTIISLLIVRTNYLKKFKLNINTVILK